MSTLAHRLRIKFGLRSEPSSEQIRAWGQRTKTFIDQWSLMPDEAGRRAAQEVFSDYGQMIFKAEADTIEALLAEALKK